MGSDTGSFPKKLLADAKQGRADALGDLLEIYRNYLQLVARTQIDLHLQGQINPSDVVQETFLKACRNFTQFRGCTEPELVAWLKRILLNNLARVVEKRIRAQKRTVRREVPFPGYNELAESSARLEQAIAGQLASPSESAERREITVIVADRLAQLPEHYRDVIVLRNLEGVAFTEIARRQGKTPSTVRSLWLRALDRLREITEAEGLQ